MSWVVKNCQNVLSQGICLIVLACQAMKKSLTPSVAKCELILTKMHALHQRNLARNRYVIIYDLTTPFSYCYL